MQTLTIKVDDDYLGDILTFLKELPKNKLEIFQHKKIELLQPKLEEISSSDPDYNYILDARERRTNGEKIYSLESVLEEL